MPAAPPGPLSDFAGTTAPRVSARCLDPLIYVWSGRGRAGLSGMDCRPARGTLEFRMLWRYTPGRAIAGCKTTSQIVSCDPPCSPAKARPHASPGSLLIAPPPLRSTPAPAGHTNSRGSPPAPPVTDTQSPPPRRSRTGRRRSGLPHLRARSHATRPQG